jgi:hypothetical protein
MEKEELCRERESEREKWISERDGLQRKFERLVEEKEKRIGERDRYLTERDEARAQWQRFEQEVNRIKDSYLWRLTYPLRSIRGQFRRWRS